MDPNKALNMTMLCDFYELTMGNGYLEHGMQDRITYFDVFFRSVPDDGGYAIGAFNVDNMEMVLAVAEAASLFPMPLSPIISTPSPKTSTKTPWMEILGANSS